MVSAVLASVVVDVISVEDSDIVVDGFEVVSSALENVLELAELAGSVGVSVVEPTEVAVVVPVGPSDVLVSELETSSSVDDDASVVESLEKMDDWVVTDDGTSSEETVVGASKPEVEADELMAWEERTVDDSELVACAEAEVDESTIWEETVVGASNPEVEADKLIVWEETVEDAPETDACEEAGADVSTIWEEAVVNASESDVSERVLLGSTELRELNSVDTAVSAVVDSPLLTLPELTFSVVLASEETAKAEVEVSKPTSRPF